MSPAGRRPPSQPGRYATTGGATAMTTQTLRAMVRDEPDWITDHPRSTLPRRLLGIEVLLVFALSLGQSGVYSVVALIAQLTAPGGLAKSSQALNQSVVPSRPYLDLTYQLLGIFFALVIVGMVIYLLARDHGRPLAILGIDARWPRFDALTGVGLAALIGIPGLALYLGARALNLNVQVIPAALTDHWWAVPVLVLSAIQNAAVEEIVVVGYLMTRLRDLRWRTTTSIATSAVIRGSYHLYQGFGAFVGNAIMGTVFALFYRRYGRVLPLIIAHSILDIVSFVGYDLFKNHLSFLH